MDLEQRIKELEVKVSMSVETLIETLHENEGLKEALKSALNKPKKRTKAERDSYTKVKAYWNENDNSIKSKRLNEWDKDNIVSLVDSYGILKVFDTIDSFLRLSLIRKDSVYRNNMNNLSWLVRIDNFNKVVEGRYKNSASSVYRNVGGDGVDYDSFMI